MRDTNHAELVKGLNADLALVYRAIISYITYAAIVTEVQRKDLGESFVGNIQAKVWQATRLADRIVHFGGLPTTIPVSVNRAVYTWQMLEEALELESDIIKRYVKRMHEAEAFGEFELLSELRAMMENGTRQKDALEGHLRKYFQEC